ncbi:Short transient receptor putative channel 4 [Cichlidogyrus casuarinus]|uniref:Short transient receptor putative channel 4 n=1 Tax=Cichlidogyrus casuarinus TaxID=1844966 RepID=A0ABD2Q3Q3_9PLAT
MSEASSSKKADLPFAVNNQRHLTSVERHFFHAVELGDLATVKRIVEFWELLPAQHGDTLRDKMWSSFHPNLPNELGKRAMTTAIELEQTTILEYFLLCNLHVGDAILTAIDKNNIAAVKMLIQAQQKQFYQASNSCKPLPPSSIFIQLRHLQEGNLAQRKPTLYGTYARDITPIVLAAHLDNFHCLRLLMEAGDRIEEPHEFRCNCSLCLQSIESDSLRHSLHKICLYQAITSPTYMSLTSKDPIRTAFRLSWHIKQLSKLESEFSEEYKKLDCKCQAYSLALLEQVHTLEELESILDYENADEVFSDFGKSNQNTIIGHTLARVRLGIKYKQKQFVAHENCQQILASIWFDGMPGFRKRAFFTKILIVLGVALVSPLLCLFYIFAPHSKLGRFIKRPIIKFIAHQTTYIFFLYRNSHYVVNQFIILVFVLGFLLSEIRLLWHMGAVEYFSNLFNWMATFKNALYLAGTALHIVALNLVAKYPDQMTINRQYWDPYDPTLVSESLFAIANIVSGLQIVELFTISHQLGPLKITLERVIRNIGQFFFFYIICIGAYGVGLTELLYFYGNLNWKRCSNPIYRYNYPGSPSESETKHSEYYELLFGSFSWITLIVLINMLIAMMDMSYNIITDRADFEWKFARTKLWMNFFNQNYILPSPFNVFPNWETVSALWIFTYEGVKQLILKLHRVTFQREVDNKEENNISVLTRTTPMESIKKLHFQSVMSEVVVRYLLRKLHSQCDNTEISKDHLDDLKADISAFRFELFDILEINGIRANNYLSYHGGSTFLSDISTVPYVNRKGRKQDQKVFTLEECFFTQPEECSQTQTTQMNSLDETSQTQEMSESDPVQSTRKRFDLV